MLKVHRRHTIKAHCTRSEWDQGYIKCRCPIFIRGTLNGKRIAKSTAKYLPPAQQRDMNAANELARLWEREGKVMRPDAAVGQIPAETETPATTPTIESCVSAFIARAVTLGNGDATLYKKRNVFQTGKQSLLAFAQHKGLRFITELGVQTLTEWRGTWKLAPLSRYKRQKQAIGFLWFCERSGWLPRNTASTITEALGKIRVKPTQTDYFEPEQYKKIIDATYIYTDRPSVDHHNNQQLGGERIRALTELMRWTGLRIRDAVTLAKEKVIYDRTTEMYSVIVYQRKTGDPVYCPIPPDVAQSLFTIPRGPKQTTDSKYFFWTGNGLPKTITSNWQRSYTKLFKLARLDKRCHPHMFRDTFAVEALLSGMRLEQVSEILGHTSIKTTEKSYMPWVRARQQHLNTSVVQSWVNQGKVAANGLHVVKKRIWTTG